FTLIIQLIACLDFDSSLSAVSQWIRRTLQIIGPVATSRYANCTMPRVLRVSEFVARSYPTELVAACSQHPPVCAIRGLGPRPVI
ncbi:hypothetical protein V8F33_014161, partial [Rhypophila sp. PSN 637]